MERPYRLVRAARIITLIRGGSTISNLGARPRVSVGGAVTAENVVGHVFKYGIFYIKPTVAKFVLYPRCSITLKNFVSGGGSSGGQTFNGGRGPPDPPLAAPVSVLPGIPYFEPGGGAK